MEDTSGKNGAGMSLRNPLHEMLQITDSAGCDDRDGDGIGDSCDNCLFLFNPSQRDRNGNGIGDECEPGVQGSPGCALAPGSSGGSSQTGLNTLVSLLLLVSALYLSIRTAQSAAPYRK